LGNNTHAKLTDPQIEHQKFDIRLRFGQDQTLQKYKIENKGKVLTHE
jgi:hypothetical protein